MLITVNTTNTTNTTTVDSCDAEGLAAETATAETESPSVSVVKKLQTSVLPVAATSVSLTQLMNATGEAETTMTTSVAVPSVESTVSSDEPEILMTYTSSEAALIVAQALASGEENFSNLVIAQVNNYVNVRSAASEDSEVVGKLYNKSVGTFISQENGWYQISSGNVTGYVKAEYVVTGSDAAALAEEVGTRIATVTTTTLRVRAEATTDSEILGMVPEGEELIVTEEKDGFVKVNIEEGDGWVSTDYVSLTTEFVQAESKAEEEARLAAEEAAKAAARASSNAKLKNSSGSSTNYNSASSYVSANGGSASGRAVAQFALQFVGNPYVYGGTSLTNGCDCSGFVMSVYANFGVSLPHSSASDRSVGSSVSSLGEAQPGDLICYSGHVALYIGDGKIVHASTSKTGIIVSNAGYRTILAIRRIF
ncbi:MAG: SH3 domain-containing protein [Lachnospiraceae bacterium]|nr:SH3 domain-containing protein [Lachnospiraceae bacterium]